MSRSAVTRLFCLFSIISSAAAVADLQQVEVGGAVTLRARTYVNTYTTGRAAELRGPARWFPFRPLGAPSLTGRFDWDDRGKDSFYAEELVRLHVRADFTDRVGAYFEFYNYDMMGEDFRSDYLHGTDTAHTKVNDLEFLQAHVDIDQAWGRPLRLRIGRQTLKIGDGWLVGERSTSVQYFSFDAVRATLTPGPFTIDLWTAKLNETLGEPGDDATFHGVYGTWKVSDTLSASLFYMLVRDGGEISDTELSPAGEWRERILDQDQYDATLLHTAGGVLSGKCGGWDYSLDAAYQWGDAAHLGARFTAPNLWGTYGDNRAEYDSWAADGEIGHTFDSPWSPRVFAGGAWFDGEDNRDLSFGDWLNPFHRPEASVSFNRLFSQTYYAPVIVDNTHMSNFNQIRAGVNFSPAEQWDVQLRAAVFHAVDAFEWPAHLKIGGRRVPILPDFSFWSTPSDKYLGTTLECTVKYAYSKDLSLTLYWGHLFTGDGLGSDGNFVYQNGTEFSGGTDSDDAEYVTFMAEVLF